MAELAQLVTQMEGGQLPLEASVAAYARGSELVKYCAAQLEKVESQVKVLEGDMLKPFSADARRGKTNEHAAVRAWMPACRPGRGCARPLPAAGTTVPAKLHEAMRYTVLGGGKRVRPLLVYASGALFGRRPAALARAACAVEMIHAYSLVHDDMPCMDDDALRRGKPTVHVAYDEATALLVGDALQAQAFEVLAGGGATCRPRAGGMLRLLAEAAGSGGMCGGQAIDLDSVGLSLTLEQLERMHQLKTGALLRARCCWAPCAARTSRRTNWKPWRLFARDRPGVPGGRRRARRDRRFGHARQDRRQGRGGQQADLCVDPGAGAVEGAGRTTAAATRMRRWRHLENKHCGCANSRT
jgi:exodeoxyribonuclease VII small subunit